MEVGFAMSDVATQVQQLEADGREIRVFLKDMPKTVPLIFVKTSETFGIVVNKRLVRGVSISTLGIAAISLVVGFVLKTEVRALFGI